MATTTTNDRNDRTVGVEDVAGVRSRISWQAILAGAIIALAANFVFIMFFSAIGLTMTEAGVRGRDVGIGALIATILSVLISLFIGGWVAAQMTAGETEREAILYGILTWAAVVGLSMMLVGMGLRAGYFAAMGGAMVVQNSPEVQNAGSWEQAARNAGVSQQSIDAAKATVDPNRAQAAANDPAARERAQEAMVAASWISLVAILLSLGTAIGGALVGRGPTFRMLPVAGVEVRRELSIP
jgi:hypothetical protein